METKVQELHQETLPPVPPENTTVTKKRAVAEDDRRTLATVLEQLVRRARGEPD